MPYWFLLFIGVVEVCGALGLILPGLTHIRPGLTPLAALGLMLVALGGMGYQIASGEPGNAVFALVIAAICAFVAYGRWKLVPHRARQQEPALQLSI